MRFRERKAIGSGFPFLCDRTKPHGKSWFAGSCLAGDSDITPEATTLDFNDDQRLLSHRWGTEKTHLLLGVFGFFMDQPWSVACERPLLSLKLQDPCIDYSLRLFDLAEASGKPFENANH
jgi:hypothetical protein